MAKKPRPGAELTTMPVESIERRIYLIRGHKVMLDSDLAALYQVPTKRLNEQVNRNLKRFPADFMFRLTRAEAQALNRSQFATGSQKHRDPRLLPYAFTEHGVAMLSAVLRSDRAIQMSILIVKAFVRLREILATHEDLAHAIEELRRRQDEQGEQITAVIETINQLLLPESVPPKRRIGFHTGEDDPSG